MPDSSYLRDLIAAAGCKDYLPSSRVWDSGAMVSHAFYAMHENNGNSAEHWIVVAYQVLKRVSNLDGKISNNLKLLSNTWINLFSSSTQVRFEHYADVASINRSVYAKLSVLNDMGIAADYSLGQLSDSEDAPRYFVEWTLKGVRAQSPIAKTLKDEFKDSGFHSRMEL